MSNNNKSFGSFLMSIVMFFAQLPFVVLFGALKAGHDSTRIMTEDLQKDALKSRGIVIVDANNKYIGIN